MLITSTSYNDLSIFFINEIAESEDPIIIILNFSLHSDLDLRDVDLRSDLVEISLDLCLLFPLVGAFLIKSYSVISSF